MYYRSATDDPDVNAFINRNIAKCPCGHTPRLDTRHFVHPSIVCDSCGYSFTGGKDIDSIALVDSWNNYMRGE